MYESVPARPQSRRRRARHGNGQPEVSYLHHALAVDKDVPGLDVSLDDVPAQELPHDAARLLLSEWLAATTQDATKARADATTQPTQDEAALPCKPSTKGWPRGSTPHAAGRGGARGRGASSCRCRRRKSG
ncbi:hypothetical protein ZWY2020_001545 [Hordeum vulgare]|nr:hypothetical protein ZWY2020_001545 [Hordeum vulgare]